MLANIAITGSSSMAEGATSALGTISSYLALLVGIVLALYILDSIIGNIRNKRDGNA